RLLRRQRVPELQLEGALQQQVAVECLVPREPPPARQRQHAHNRAQVRQQSSRIQRRFRRGLLPGSLPRRLRHPPGVRRPAPQRPPPPPPPPARGISGRPLASASTAAPSASPVQGESRASKPRRIPSSSRQSTPVAVASASASLLTDAQTLSRIGSSAAKPAV